MQYGSYRFTCTLHDNALLPPFRGSTFRGAFGVALKNVVCALRRNTCDGCLLVGRCIYARTFEIQPHAHEADRSRVVTPPHPYIISSPFVETTRMSAGDQFSFDLILFGEANEWLPYFICAFDAMETTGIGKKIERHRSRFSITSVTTDGVTVYDAIGKSIRPGTLSHDVPPPAEGPEGAGTLAVTFTTPLRLKNDNRFSSHLSFELMQRAVLRRVSALHAAFGTGDPPLDYRGLVAAAGKVDVISSALQWQDWRRWSNRQDDEMSLGGLIGAITYRGAIGRFLPLIEQARLFHLAHD